MDTGGWLQEYVERELSNKCERWNIWRQAVFDFESKT